MVLKRNTLWVYICQIIISPCLKLSIYGAEDHLSPPVIRKNTKQNNKAPLIIAHRGARGMYPEHTKLAYREAIKQGADYIECDVQVTKDLQLMCSHNPWISEVTLDLSNNSEYGLRKTTKTVFYEDPYENKYIGMNVTDWFLHDFTEHEIKKLSRIQPLKHRDPNYNFQEKFCSLQEYIDIAKDNNVGIYPEIKYPYFINSILSSRGHNETVEELLLEALNRNGCTDVNSKCFIQSFERQSLEIIKRRTNIKCIYLLWEDVKLHKLIIKDKMARNKEMWSVAMNWAKKENIFGFGLDKNFLIEKNAKNYISKICPAMINEAHKNEMMIHAYTFAHDENKFPWNYGKDPFMEYKSFAKVGIDVFFTDFPAIAEQALGKEYHCLLNMAIKSSQENVAVIILTGLFLLYLLSI